MDSGSIELETDSYNAKERGDHEPLLTNDGNFTPGKAPPRDDFKQENVPHYYPMTAKKHGICLVINNVKFVGRDEREGSEIDEQNLIHTWRYLGYRVEVRRNCSLKHIKKIFDDVDGFLEDLNDSVEEKDSVENDSFVCCILSHGIEHVIASSDNQPIEINYLERQVGKSRTLKSKPKLFFVQACRSAPGTKALAEVLDQFDSTPQNTQTTDRSDIYFSYATSLGNVAKRNPIFGSLFVTELCYLLCQHATAWTLYDIQLALNKAVPAGTYIVLHGKKYAQQPSCVGSLKNRVHFFHSTDPPTTEHGYTCSLS